MQDVILDFKGYSPAGEEVAGEWCVYHERPHVRIYTKFFQRVGYGNYDLEDVIGFIINHEILHAVINRLEGRNCGNRSHFVMACGLDQCFGKSFATFAATRYNKEYKKAVGFYYSEVLRCV